jgi:hypothetical protein
MVAELLARMEAPARVLLIVLDKSCSGALAILLGLQNALDKQILFRECESSTVYSL